MTSSNLRSHCYTRQLACILLTLALAGCHGAPGIPTPAREQAKAAEQEALDGQRMDLEQVPPPSKTRYMAITTLDSWENPYLTVQPGMVTLHVLMADPNPNAYGAGGMMRPLNARKQDLNVSLQDLPEALSSIPHSAWPYGRVAAVEEAHKTPASGLPQVRRNMEATMKVLNDLGIVIYEMGENGAH